MGSNVESADRVKVYFSSQIFEISLPFTVWSRWKFQMERFTIARSV